MLGLSFRSHPHSARLLSMFACAVVSTLTVMTVQAQDVIRFGAPLPLTGPLAPEALKQQQGYNLWAEQVNKAGGIKVGDKKMKVEIVYADYQSNTPRAVQTAERLITQDKVNFLFSPFGSGAAKAASTVSENMACRLLHRPHRPLRSTIKVTNTCLALSHRMTH